MSKGAESHGFMPTSGNQWHRCELSVLAVDRCSTVDKLLRYPQLFTIWSGSTPQVLLEYPLSTPCCIRYATPQLFTIWSGSGSEPWGAPAGYALSCFAVALTGVALCPLQKSGWNPSFIRIGSARGSLACHVCTGTELVHRPSQARRRCLRFRRDGRLDIAADQGARPSYSYC
jgi:hypothetical protein